MTHLRQNLTLNQLFQAAPDSGPGSCKQLVMGVMKAAFRIDKSLPKKFFSAISECKTSVSKPTLEITPTDGPPRARYLGPRDFT